MSNELDFTTDRATKVEYLMTQLSTWRNSACETAGNYCQFIYDTDYDMFCDADDALSAMEGYYLD